MPKELFGDGVIKQKAKLREMNTTGYQQPMDFADLAGKADQGRADRNADGDQKLLSRRRRQRQRRAIFVFCISDGPGGDRARLAQISDAALNWRQIFRDTKYDLNNPADRKQMRMRLLRMFNKRAKPILQEVAEAYFAKFGTAAARHVADSVDGLPDRA